MQKNDLVEQITLYLSGGGLFNPELANHVAVRNLLIECREALAQPEQEPVAWIRRHPNGALSNEILLHVQVERVRRESGAWVPLYTTPPQRKPLTDEEIILIVAECAASHQHTDIHFARAIERAHGIKELV